VQLNLLIKSDPGIVQTRQQKINVTDLQAPIVERQIEKKRKQSISMKSLKPYESAEQVLRTAKHIHEQQQYGSGNLSTPLSKPQLSRVDLLHEENEYLAKLSDKIIRQNGGGGLQQFIKNMKKPVGSKTQSGS
jgi:hypothetical protein